MLYVAACCCYKPLDVLNDSRLLSVVNRFFVESFTIRGHIFRTDITGLPLHLYPSGDRCAANRAEIIALFKVYAIFTSVHCVASLVLCVVSIKQMYSNASLIAILATVKDCKQSKIETGI